MDIIKNLISDLNNCGGNVFIFTPLLGAMFIFKKSYINFVSDTKVILQLNKKEGDEYVALNLTHLTSHKLENGALVLHFGNDED